MARAAVGGRGGVGLGAEFSSFSDAVFQTLLPRSFETVVVDL